MSIDPRVDIGYAHLKVADIERSLELCCSVLGFEFQQRMDAKAAFVSAGGSTGGQQLVYPTATGGANL